MFSCNLVNAIEWGFWLERRPVGSRVWLEGDRCLR